MLLMGMYIYIYLFLYVAFTVKEIRYMSYSNQAITINNNFITLPPDIFDNLSVK